MQLPKIVHFFMAKIIDHMGVELQGKETCHVRRKRFMGSPTVVWFPVIIVSSGTLFLAKTEMTTVLPVWKKSYLDRIRLELSRNDRFRRD